MEQYLFLYGTLLPERAPAEVAKAVRQLRRIGRGSVSGKLYDLGEYPAAILDKRSRSRISGEIFEVPGGPAVLKTLDKYEGFNPRHPRASLFVRKRWPVVFQNGKKLNCWLYVYNRNPGSAPRIEYGDYRHARQNIAANT
ncbi:MAG: gamma-glutamylcyclotransferase family protein [Terriglobales bacterium]